MYHIDISDLQKSASGRLFGLETILSSLQATDAPRRATKYALRKLSSSKGSSHLLCAMINGLVASTLLAKALPIFSHLLIKREFSG